MKRLMAALAVSTAFSASALAESRTIVLTNDDGLTANVVALYSALKTEGYDVIVSVPCQNQSGMSGALSFSGPVAPLSENCLHDAAQAGDPPAGPVTLEGLEEGDLYYAYGTPVMALMYGLDVVAANRWGGDPDLVLSGPNGGQNVGGVTLNSGTVANAQHAAVRGIPAIALSASGETDGAPLEPSEDSRKVAELSVQLVKALDGASPGAPILPEGLALNVNFPDSLDGAAWRPSQIGTFNAYDIRYVESLAGEATPITRALADSEGVALPDLPGIAFDFNRAEPTEDQLMDETIVYRSHIAVSPMHAGFAHHDPLPAPLADLLEGLSSGEE